MIIAAAVSVPPYGTLVYEQWQAHRRQASQRVADRQIVARVLIQDGSKYLILQPADRAFWCLPGGVLRASESPQQAAIRAVTVQTGVRPTLTNLRYVYEYQHSPKIKRMEFYFEVSNAKAFTKVKQSPDRAVEAITFATIADTTDFEPSFLKASLALKTSEVQFIYKL